MVEGGGDLYAHLEAWLNPSSCPESKREAALVPNLEAFRTLASARSVAGAGAGAGGRAGGRAGWSLEGDMQLCEALNEWSKLLAVAHHTANLPFRDLHAMLAAPAGDDADEDVPPARLGGRALAMTQDVKRVSRSKRALTSATADELLARAAVLLSLNSRAARALPLLCLALPEEEWEKERAGPSMICPVSLAGLPGFEGGGGAAAAAAGPAAADDPAPNGANGGLSWQPLCTARRLRSSRRLLLTSTKRAFWDSLLTTTTTPTALHHDEYVGLTHHPPPPSPPPTTRRPLVPHPPPTTP